MGVARPDECLRTERSPGTLAPPGSNIGGLQARKKGASRWLCGSRGCVPFSRSSTCGHRSRSTGTCSASRSSTPPRRGRLGLGVAPVERRRPHAEHRVRGSPSAGGSGPEARGGPLRYRTVHRVSGRGRRLRPPGRAMRRRRAADNRALWHEAVVREGSRRRSGSRAARDVRPGPARGGGGRRGRRHLGEVPLDALAADPMGGPVISAGLALMQSLMESAE